MHVIIACLSFGVCPGFHLCGVPQKLFLICFVWQVSGLLLKRFVYVQSIRINGWILSFSIRIVWHFLYNSYVFLFNFPVKWFLSRACYKGSLLSTLPQFSDKGTKNSFEVASFWNSFSGLCLHYASLFMLILEICGSSYPLQWVNLGKCFPLLWKYIIGYHEVWCG